MGGGAKTTVPGGPGRGSFRALRSSASILLAIAILVFITPGLHGQSGTSGSIFGTVRDKTGALVANAEVTATNVQTGVNRASTTTINGYYQLDMMPAGQFTVEINAASFPKFEKTSVVVIATQSTRVDATLSPAGVAANFEVESTAPLINTDNAEVGTTVEHLQITELPIVNRNVYTLLNISPGVQQNSNQVGLGLPEQHTSMNGGVEAGYSGSVNYYLDGGANVGSLRNSGNILPNPDAIDEYRILANNYSAEYGSFAGGVISVVTKSGTNHLHGTIFEFLRNNNLNANNWGAKIPLAPLHRNQFGFTLGGPIRRNRTFFFASYAGLRQSSYTFVNTAVLPTALERSGDFSQSVNQPVDPLTGMPFPNDTIPASRVDTVASRILSTYVPAVANGPGSTFQANISTPTNSDDVLAKVDHQIKADQRISGSYFETSGFQWVNSGNSQLPYSRLRYSWRQHNFNISHTWLKSNRTVNQAWLVYTRAFGSRVSYPQASLQDLGSTYQMQGAPNLPRIDVTNYFSLGEQISGPTAGNNYYALRDLVSVVKGKHDLRFGAEQLLNKGEQFTNLQNFGSFDFDGSVAGNGFADFLLGIPSSVTQDKPVAPSTNTWTTSSYFQDDFRVTERLTLNLGLRWDIQTPPTDPANRQASFNPGQQSTIHPQMPTGLVYPGDKGVPRGIAQLSWHHFSPRVGFACDPFGTGKTSIRGAFGVFWGTVSGNGWNQPSNFVPFTVSLSFPNAASVTGATLSDPYRNYPGGSPFPYNGEYIIGSNVKTIALNYGWPYAYHMNLSIQRLLTPSASVMAAYVGSIAKRLPFLVDRNYPVSTATATNSASNILSRRPNQVLGQLQNMESIANSSFHSLQLSATQRLRHGISFTANYVFSKTLTSEGIQDTTISAQDYNDLRTERGRADTDMRQMFNLAMVWQLNYYQGDSRFLKVALNGWQISPIVTVRSGLPLTILNGVDANLDGNGTDRADLVGTPHLGHRSAAEWFNTAAFKENPIVQGNPVDGNSGRNILDAPGLRNLDLAVAKTFNIGERFRAQLRAEASNAFNIVNLGTPGTTIAAPSSFGVIRSAQPMRQLQLGFRLLF